MTSKTSGVATALFRGLVEHASIGMVVLEEIVGEFSIIFANTRALEILELKNIENLEVQTLFPEAERAGQYIKLSREILGRDGLTPEALMRKSNNHHFLASISVTRLEVEGRKVSLLSFQDVTIERKLSRDLVAKQTEIERAYSELLEQNSQLKLLDQAKDKFIALTTHELRTPLSAILATADVLELKLYESEEQRELFVKTIGEQGRHLLELVNDVLDFAKIRAGKMDFYVEKVDLRKIAAKLASNMINMAEQDEIKIIVEENPASVEVWADVLRLKEILNNVYSNAIKYNRRGGSVTISVFEFPPGGDNRFGRIAVRDTGVGIPHDKISSVFNEFETVGHLSRHHKGTGLGMPISRRLAESMGGQLSLQSELGVGSVFYIDIPFDRVLSDDHYRSRPDQDTDYAA